MSGPLSWRAGVLLMVSGLAALVSAGCREAVCGRAGENANVTGEWSLTATGEQNECTPGTDSKLELRSQMAIPIGQLSSGSSGADSLGLARSIPVDGGFFNLSGKVEGSCVEFAIEEGSGEGERRFSFTGHIRGAQIEGNFSETVPGPCPTKGRFRVDITPRPASGDAGSRRVLFNPDASVVTSLEDAGCLFPDGGGFSPDDGGLTDDAGVGADGGDGFDGGYGCRRKVRTTLEHTFPCNRNDYCARGLCATQVCVVGCERGTDCQVGESCIELRCEPAPGCGCSGGGGALGAGALLLTLGAFRRRRPGSKG